MSEAIPIQTVSLSRTTIQDYCSFFDAVNYCGFWWYQFPHPLFGNYSKPFKGKDNHWWFQVKPGFCWSAHGITPLSADSAVFDVHKFILGYQFPIAQDANSTIVLNLVRNLPEFSIKDIDKTKLRALRKAARFFVVEKIGMMDEALCRQALDVWESFVKRTKWKKSLSLAFIKATWLELMKTPGTSILGCFEKERRRLVAWLIVKIIDSTAYIDTLASHSDYLELRPNDYLIYSFLSAAKNIPSVQQAHYSLKSNIPSLERFKQSLGFKPTPVPSYYRMRPVVESIMKRMFPSHYKRILGRTDN